jgi:hypothetical protein
MKIRNLKSSVQSLHSLAGQVMLYWWEITHLYHFLFPAK